MKRTAVRELLKVTSRPDIISFAGGLPAAELFPIDQIRAALGTVLDRFGGQSLQYSETEGLPALRDWVARSFARDQFPVNRDNVLITSGAQQALELIGRVLLDPGDIVAVENPTYLALLSAWRPLGVKFLAVPSDGMGLRTDALEQILESQRPKVIYLVPNFQNPQGTTLSLERRHHLVRLLHDYKVVLVEDNPYGELRYGGESLAHLLELDGAGGALARSGQGRPAIPSAASAPPSPAPGLPGSHVIYTGTFSKVLVPGLRVGWAIAAPEVIDKLVQAKQAADLHTSTLSQYLVLELVSHGFLDLFLPRLRHAYAARRDVMLAALEEHFPPAVTWTRPDGGLFLMVTLPCDVDASALLPRALRQGVAFVPGAEFHLEGEGQNTLRLNFSNAAPDRIRRGIEALARVIRGS